MLLKIKIKDNNINT